MRRVLGRATATGGLAFVLIAGTVPAAFGQNIPPIPGGSPTSIATDPLQSLDPLSQLSDLDNLPSFGLSPGFEQDPFGVPPNFEQLSPDQQLEPYISQDPFAQADPFGQDVFGSPTGFNQAPF